MFTGIIESLGELEKINRDGSNRDLTVRSDFTSELRVDQSVSHNGACLTVTEIVDGNHYKVTAVKETLEKTNIGSLKEGDLLNLERSVTTEKLLDGHIVQGHVDQVGSCIDIKDEQGSKVFTFSYREKPGCLIVEKGSVAVNGISLTAFDVSPERFSVAVIPYTLQHTNLNNLVPGDKVNLEFDILGKYAEKLMADYRKT